MYIMLSTRPYIYFVVSIVNRYQSNPRSLYRLAIKHTLKYLMGMRDYMLVYRSEDLIVTGFTNSRFQLNHNSHRSMSEYVFTTRW